MVGKFEKICMDIKSLKIQGATNVAKAGLKALFIKNDPKKIISLRPTEPALQNALEFASRNPKKYVPIALKHFEDAEKKIAKIGSKLIRNGSVVFTHCHSSSVVEILKEAAKTKKFTVWNTETRPLFQGRITAKELAAEKIKVNCVVDSAAYLALKEADIFLIGADAITEKKIYNKIGSNLMALTAKQLRIPLYVCSDSWKFTSKKVFVEERKGKEIWENPPKGVSVKNFAFESIDMGLVKLVVSELGVLSQKDFIRKVKKVNF